MGVLLEALMVLRGVAEMPDTAVYPLLAFVGGVLAVEPSRSFKAAKLKRDIWPGPRYLRDISQNCGVRSLVLAMIPSHSLEISSFAII